MLYLIKMQKDKKQVMSCGGGSAGAGAVYGLGMIGAAVYFLQQATNFQEGVIGVLKALVWPAFLIYKVLSYFRM